MAPKGKVWLMKLKSGAIVLAILVALLSPAHADRLDEVKARGTLIVGVSDTTPPFSFKRPSENVVIGYDIDLVRAVAKRLGVTVQTVSLSSAERIPMLQQDKLDLVATLRKQGKREVGEYYSAYAAAKRWAYAAGIVDGRAAMIVYDREVSLETPAYFVAIGFDGDRVVSVHDFLYARYAMDGIDLFLLYPELRPR